MPSFIEGEPSFNVISHEFYHKQKTLCKRIGMHPLTEGEPRCCVTPQEGLLSCNLSPSLLEEQLSGDNSLSLEKTHAFGNKMYL